ncbi:MAG: aspartate aminotransferase family protein [Solirubrobacteraceae bacterium]
MSVAPLAGDGDALRALLAEADAALDAGRRERAGAAPAGPPGRTAATLDALLGADGALPAHGRGDRDALAGLVRFLAAGHTDPADPACAAHLHCPPLAVAVAADLAVSVLNPSLDSWDQGPSAAAVEDRTVAALADLVGFDPAVSCGTMTTGATASTLTALLLAREAAGPELRIACSDQAHFSVGRAAQVLGLPDGAVHTVATDATGRIAVAALAQRLAEVPGPWAIVATAGTTDLGAIDPLVRIADLAAEHRAWLHVDAAYGGGALFSDRLAPLLTGIDRADSVALDLHKLGWQPVAAGALLLRDAARRTPLDLQVAYLNAADDDAAGYGDRLGRSLRTTRRPDAFKLLVTMRAIGRSGLGALVEHCHDLAHVAADAADADPRLELHSRPTLTTVLLRPADDDPTRRDRACAELRRLLLRTGRAVVGRTELPGEGPGRRWLKLTLLHPHASPDAVRTLVAEIAAACPAPATSAARG